MCVRICDGVDEALRRHAVERHRNMQVQIMNQVKGQLVGTLHALIHFTLTRAGSVAVRLSVYSTKIFTNLCLDMRHAYSKTLLLQTPEMTELQINQSH